MGKASCGSWPTGRFRSRIASPIPRRIAAGLFAFLCAFCCIAAASRASSAFLPEQGSALVSIDAVSQDAKTVIAQLATSAGVNVVIDDSTVSKVTVHLANVPFDYALTTIAHAAGAEVAVDRDLYVVTNSRAYYGPPQAARRADGLIPGQSGRHNREPWRWVADADVDLLFGDRRREPQRQEETRRRHASRRKADIVQLFRERNHVHSVR